MKLLSPKANPTFCCSSRLPFLGFMRVFFGKMGIKNVRFKPAYNPYTEVSSVDATEY